MGSALCRALAGVRRDEPLASFAFDASLGCRACRRARDSGANLQVGADYGLRVLPRQQSFRLHVRLVCLTFETGVPAPAVDGQHTRPSTMVFNPHLFPDTYISDTAYTRRELQIPRMIVEVCRQYGRLDPHALFLHNPIIAADIRQYPGDECGSPPAEEMPKRMSRTRALLTPPGSGDIRRPPRPRPLCCGA